MPVAIPVFFVSPPPQRARVQLPGGQRLRSFPTAGRPRQPGRVREPCDDGSGPSEVAVQGRHVDVQGVRQEQIHVRRGRILDLCG